MKLKKNNSKANTYIGRFAPSPTGPLHMGSLLVALASYLEARASKGQWLVRIEDIDRFRCQPEYVPTILSTLEGFGLTWDGEVVLQSQRHKYYQVAFEQLEAQQLLYHCRCTRKQLQPYQGVYPGICRDLQLSASHDRSVRVRLPSGSYTWSDLTYGEQILDWHQVGDVLIRRKDQLFAYQLVVVVDDALQGITDVVRGQDLLSSTAAQIGLQHCLNYARPQYRHIPIIVDEQGHKLSKQTHAAPVEVANAIPILCRLLACLGQPQLVAGDFCSVTEVLQWAVSHWQPQNIPRVAQLNLCQ